VAERPLLILPAPDHPAARRKKGFVRAVERAVYSHYFPC
jgi:hypothetical protein